MSFKEPETVRDLIGLAYADLQRAHRAVVEGESEYKKKHHMMKAHFYRLYREDRAKFGSLLDDEKWKWKQAGHCAYCGSRERLSVDHLIPRKYQGRDSGDNGIPACRSCNSSKGSKDLLEWFAGKEEKIPSLFVFRVYLKLAYLYCEQSKLLQENWQELAERAELPFSLHAMYGSLRSLSSPKMLKLHAEPTC